VGFLYRDSEGDALTIKQENELDSVILDAKDEQRNYVILDLLCESTQYQ